MGYKQMETLIDKFSFPIYFSVYTNEHLIKNKGR